MMANSTTIETNDSISEDRVTSIKEIEEATKDEMDDTSHSPSVRKYNQDTIIECDLAAKNMNVASTPCRMELEPDHNSDHESCCRVDDNSHIVSEEMTSGNARDDDNMEMHLSDSYTDDNGHIVDGIEANRDTDESDDAGGTEFTPVNDSISEDHHHHEGASNSYKQHNRIGHSDSMTTVQSEQQRLHREANISIPYCKPKQHSLQEFLSRRTIIQPSLTKGNAIIDNLVPNSNSLKMSTEELKKYAEFLDVRVGDAREFYSSTTKTSETNETNETSETSETSVYAKDNDKPLMTTTEHSDTSSIQNNDNHFNDNNLTSEEAQLSVQTNNEQNKDKNEVSLRPSFAQKLVQPILENMKGLPVRPILTGEPDKFVDLTNGNWIEKDTSTSGTLIKRLFANGKPVMENSCETIITEDAKVKPMTAKSKATVSNYFEMQRNLKMQIDNRRQNDLMKQKCGEEPNLGDIIKSNDDDVDDAEDNCCSSDDEYNADSDHEGVYNDEEEEELTDRSEDSVTEICDENGDENNDGDHNNGNDVNKQNNQEEFESFGRRRNRIVIRPIDDDDDDDVDDDKNQQISVSTQRLQGNGNDDAMDEPNDSLKLNSPPTTTSNALLSQIPKHEAALCNDAETVPEYDELIALCSGVFEKSLEAGKITNENHETISTDLHQNAPNGDDELCRGISKRRQCNIEEHLEHSDDEDEDSNNETRKYIDRNDRPQTSSNKEEILAHKNTVSDNDQIDQISKLNESAFSSFPDLFTKCNKESKRQPHISYNDFIENEAELSDIELFSGSSDEDEDDDANLDRYDIELGDEDEYDAEQLQNELAKVQAYQIMEEDAQRIRKIQDMFVNKKSDDDGGRQRKFRWNNKENSSLTTSEENRGLAGGDADADADADLTKPDNHDELLELQWRQMCYEQFLNAQAMSSSNTVLKLNRSRTSDSKNIRFIDAKNCISAPKSKPNSDKPDASFLINKQMNIASMKSSSWGSFLKCDQDTLKKLVNVTKSVPSNHKRHDDDDITMTSTVVVKPIRAENSKNFVFSTLTAAERAKLKRKHQALLTDNGGSEERYDENGEGMESAIGKRAKSDALTPPKCQIDKLLDPTI